ncbi:MAG: hypothetical protein ACREE6_17005, partial [Limisphaerales bacterium]
KLLNVAKYATGQKTFWRDDGPGYFYHFHLKGAILVDEAGKMNRNFREISLAPGASEFSTRSGRAGHWKKLRRILRAKAFIPTWL